MRRILALAVLALGACSTAPQAVEPPAAAPAAPAAAPHSPIPKPGPSAAKDSCGAAAMQHLVGRPRTEIPIPLNPSRQRVACTTCPVTQDFSPQRLNFFFDAQTGVIKEIRCG